MLDDFHDSTLIDIVLTWATRTVVITAKSGNLHLSILAKNVKALAVPVEYPWGRSVSINSIAVTDSPNEKQLQVEMQSGDVIRVTCESFQAIDTPLVMVR